MFVAQAISEKVLNTTLLTWTHTSNSMLQTIFRFQTRGFNCYSLESSL